MLLISYVCNWEDLMIGYGRREPPNTKRCSLFWFGESNQTVDPTHPSKPLGPRLMIGYGWKTTKLTSMMFGGGSPPSKTIYRRVPYTGGSLHKNPIPTNPIDIHIKILLYFADNCRSSVKFDDIQRDLVKIQRYLVEILLDSVEFQPDLASFSHISLPWLRQPHKKIRLSWTDSSSRLMASPNIEDLN